MPRTGRPREFDLDEAVSRAMGLFWEQGYEATSLARLKATMGDISSASFYAAFGSKEALFRSAVDRYLATHGQVTAPLFDKALPPREAIERALRGSARMQADPSHPPGCLIVLSAITCSPENRHLQTRLMEERQCNRAGFRACVQRGVATGDLRPTTDVAALASVFETFLVGLSLQIRDAVPFATLDASITEIMQVWDNAAADHADAYRPSRLSGGAGEAYAGPDRS